MPVVRGAFVASGEVGVPVPWQAHCRRSKVSGMVNAARRSPWMTASKLEDQNPRNHMTTSTTGTAIHAGFPPHSSAR